MRCRTLVPRPIVSSVVFVLTLAAFAPLAASAGFDDAHRIWTVHGPKPGSQFGAAVAPAGDVNGDGYPDVIVGAPYFDERPGRYRGKAFVYYGSATGLSSVPGWEVEGEDDGSEFGAQFGSAVASAGDVNGDGFDDVIVGAPGYDSIYATNAGRIYVFLGSAHGLSTVPAFIAEGQGNDLGHLAGLGYAVASGDFNGDGFSDIAATEVGKYGGYVVVFYGSPSGPSRDGAWYGPGGGFSGRTISTRDVNGDGYDDLTISSQPIGGEEIRYFAGVTFGSPTGLPTVPIGEPLPGITWPDTASLTPIGDVDGDGHVDLLGVHFVGFSQDLYPSYVLYRGSALGPRIQGLEMGPAFQPDSLVFAAGDLNGDGFADAIAIDGSLFYIYFGSRSGFSPLADGMGPAPGTTIAALPDVNGDRFSDLLVGDATHDRVDVYRGGADWSFTARADLAVSLCVADCFDTLGIAVKATNTGLDPVRVRLVDIIPPSLPGFTWSCFSWSGAVSTRCGPVPTPQSGDVDVMITLLPGGFAEYVGDAALVPPVVETASLVLPDWVSDPDLSNNHAVAVYAPPPVEIIFFDRFDSGDLSKWSSHTGDVSVVPERGRPANDVLRATAPRSGAAVVRDETPARESDYNARFVLDARGFGQMTSRTRVVRAGVSRAVVLAGYTEASSSAVFELRLDGTHDGVFLRGAARLDSGSMRETPPVPLDDATHVVEVSWHRSGAPLANDGRLQIRLDGADAGVLPDLANDAVGGIDSVDLGLDTSRRAIPPVFGHAVRLDDFESWRVSPSPAARR